MWNLRGCNAVGGVKLLTQDAIVAFDGICLFTRQARKDASLVECTIPHFQYLPIKK